MPTRSLISLFISTRSLPHYRNNGVGNAISAVTVLEVNTAAHFAKTFQLVKIQRGQRAELTCEALGDPPLSVSWARERNPLPLDRFIREDTAAENAMLSRVFLQAAGIEDSGFFTCTASNPFGRCVSTSLVVANHGDVHSEEKKLQLVVQGPPEPPFDVKAVDVKSRSVTISWSEPRTGNSPLLGYFIEYTLRNGRWAARIALLQRRMMYCSELD